MLSFLPVVTWRKVKESLSQAIMYQRPCVGYCSREEYIVVILVVSELVSGPQIYAEVLTGQNITHRRREQDCDDVCP